MLILPSYLLILILAQAHVLALNALEKGNHSGVYNLGNGNGFSVKEVIETAEKVTGVTINKEISARRPGDPAVLVASSDRIRKELGWQPQYLELEQIINSAWKWHKSHPDGYKY